MWVVLTMSWATLPVSASQDDSLEHLAQLPHVEEVVELGWRGQHLGLCSVPQRHRHRHKPHSNLHKIGTRQVSRVSTDSNAF